MSRHSARLHAGEIKPCSDDRLELRLSVTNTGRETWTPGSNIFVSYQVLDQPATALLAEGQRTPFDRDVPPGAEAEIRLSIDLPSEDGAYRVLVSPIEEQVAWFFERGSECLALDVSRQRGALRVGEARKITASARRKARARAVLTRLLLAPFAILLRHRRLIASMVRRDIHGRYRGSMAGLFWTVIHPLLLVLTYFFVFGIVLKVRFPGPQETIPVNFLFYFLGGMLPWLAFNEALGRAPSVLLEHRTLVTRVLFPVDILPVNIALSGLTSGFFALIVFIVALLAVRGSIPVTAFYLPALIVPQLLLTIGLCWFLAALGVFLRDTGQFMAFILTLWFFATPICYPESALPAEALWLFQLNPMYVMARSYRAIFLEHAAPPWTPLLTMSLAGLLAFILGYGWFHKSRKSFADLL